LPAGAPSFHVWVPGISETGGIQHYSHCLVQALASEHPCAAIRVFSKNDLNGHRRDVSGVILHAFGRVPAHLRTLVFAAVCLWWRWRERPTVCILTHPHFAKVFSLPWLRADMPILAVAHGIEVWGHLPGRLLAGLQACAGVLPVSEFTRATMLREGGLSANRVIVVPDTFREQAFAPGPKPAALLARHSLRADQPVLLTVGRLAASEAYKGHDQVIAALPAIRATNPEVRYVIVGTGDDQARLQACAEQHGQTDAVIFAGFIPEHELADYYRLCDAFVMPSTGEGFGIVYLEALASGKPCIVGNQDASPEAIGDGRWGFAINPRSPAAIAEAVIKLITRAHDKPWLHEPDTLRQEVIERYGFAAFKRSLLSALHRLVPTSDQASGIRNQESGI